MENCSPKIPMSPYLLKLSSNHNLDVPGRDGRRSFTPMHIANTPKTPNLSPIFKPPKTPDSASFLKRRQPKDVIKRIQRKEHQNRKQFSEAPIVRKFEPVLNQSISVKSTLKALNLLHLTEIFEREEIDTMAIFFTLSYDDLVLIGVADENDRAKILNFLASFKTPTKPVRNLI